MNKQEHQRFIAKFTGLMTEFQEKGASFTMVMKLYRELSDWLIHHILGVDCELWAYVPNKSS